MHLQETFQKLFSRLSGGGFTSQQFPGSSAANVAVRIAATGLTFLLAILFARLMGPDGFGIYSYAIAVVTLLAILTRMGLPTLVVREVARYQAKSRWGSLRGLMLRALQLIVVMSVLSMAIVVGFMALFSDSIAAVQQETLLWALVLIPSIALGACGGAALRGLGHVIQGQIAEQLLRPGLLLVLLVSTLVIAGPEWVTAPTGMALHAFSAIAAILLSGFFFLRTIPSELRTTSSSFQEERRWKSSLIPLSLLAGLLVITSQTDILMLGLFVEAEDIGVYRVAWQGASLVNLVLFAIGLTVEPTIARLHGLGESRSLQEIVKTSGRMAFVISLLMSAVLILFGRQLLAFVFGAAYVGSYLPMAILCAGQIALAFSGWAVLVLNMTGNERTTARFTAYAAVANVVANAVLIPLLGLPGAAIATASTMFLWKLGLAYAARQVAGINTMVMPLPYFRQTGDKA